MCPSEQTDMDSPPYRFVRQKAIKRRCWPDPSDAAARRDAATHPLPRVTPSTSRPVSTIQLLDSEISTRGQENRGFDSADGGAARLWSRRVEDAASNTQGAQLGWQEPPRKVLRSSSRALGVQEALSALLWQPYECRQENSSSSWLDDSEDSTGEWPVEGNNVLSSTQPLLVLVNDLDSRTCNSEHQGTWSHTIRPIEALVSQSTDHQLSSSSSSSCSTTSTPGGGAGVLLASAAANAVASDCEANEVVQLSRSADVLRMVSVCVEEHGSSCCCAPENVTTSSISTSTSVNNNSSNCAGVITSNSNVNVVRCTDVEEETEDEERRLCSNTIQPRIVSDSSNVSSVQIVSCPAERTFTSTEAQTDHTGDHNNAASSSSSIDLRNNNREQRRRERRERRQQRQRNNVNNQVLSAPSATEIWASQSTQHLLEAARVQGNGTVLAPDRLLPDLLLNSHHLPPPYSTLPLRPVGPPPPAPPPGLVPLVAGPPQLIATTGSPPPHPGQPLAMRFSFPISPNSRRCRGGGGSGRGSHLSEEPKSCCGVALTQAASIRWFIVLIAFVGVCCAVVGTVLGAMRASGREHLTISLLMIGVGIVLVMVSGVGWRLTAHDAPSCRAMLGLGGSGGGGGIVTGDGDGAEPNRRFVPRLPPSYGRPHHPYAAMIYPEFQYRPPPPSYQASMQEYRLRLLLLDRGGGGQPSLAMAPPPPPLTGIATTVSPPPTYRSHVGSMLRAPMLFRRDHSNTAAPGESSTCSSRPPSYRSRAGSTRPASIATAGIEPSLHVESRRASLLMLAGCSSAPGTPPPSSHNSSPQPPSVCDVSVICVGGDSPKIFPLPPASTGSEKASLADESSGTHLVTIVQTGDVSPTSDSGVTVTVSGLLASSSNDSVPQLLFSPASNGADGEMEILAHL